MDNYYDNLERYSDNTAVITPESEVISYGNLVREADNVASFTKSRQIVFLICSNTLEALEGYACLASDHIRKYRKSKASSTIV